MWLLVGALFFGLCLEVGGFRHFVSSTRLQLHHLSPAVALKSSQIARPVVADFAQEIENAVGSEIYGPIFRYGIFIIFGGIVSAFITAFLVSRGDLWSELRDEFSAANELTLASMAAKEDELFEKKDLIVAADKSAEQAVLKDLDI